MSFSSLKDRRETKNKESPAEIFCSNNFMTLSHSLKKKPVKLMHESKIVSSVLCVLRQTGHFGFL